MYKNCYYVILLGSNMKNGVECYDIRESDSMENAAAMVEYAQQHAPEFMCETCTFRICYGGNVLIEMDYDRNVKSFSLPEFCFNPADFLRSFRTVEMTPAEAAAYIEQNISK